MLPSYTKGVDSALKWSHEGSVFRRKNFYFRLYQWNVYFACNNKILIFIALYSTYKAFCHLSGDFKIPFQNKS